MRTNRPVTQHEYQFPGTETLLSPTRTRRHICDANAALSCISMGDQAQRLVDAVKVFSA